MLVSQLTWSDFSDDQSAYRNLLLDTSIAIFDPRIPTRPSLRPRDTSRLSGFRLPGPARLRESFHNHPVSTIHHSSVRCASSKSSAQPLSLPHLIPSSHEIHQVTVSEKESTHRVALAIGYVGFSNSETLRAIRAHLLEKGDVLAVARVGAIQAVKDTARSVVLAHAGVGVEGCVVEVVDVDPHPQNQSGVTAYEGTQSGSPSPESIEEKAKHLKVPIGSHGGVRVAVKVETTAKTGVEMEALAGVMGAALNVIDMVKAVDREVFIGEVKVVGKKGGRSGDWGIWA